VTSSFIRIPCLLLLVLTACFRGDDPNITASGKGKPEISAELPATVEAGSVQEAAIEVTNPGPGDMEILAIAFALVGPAGEETEFPSAIVPLGARRQNRAVISVSPEPTGVSDDGTVYTFGPLEGGAPRIAEGESITVLFELRMPDEPGPAANSVQAYDGNEIERARGVRLSTEVRG
jgi:hypothetical protein